MIKKARVEARIESGLKNKVSKILRRLDLSESDAIRIYYRQIALNKGLPFALKIPNEDTIKALNESVENMTEVKSVKDLFNKLEL